MTQLRILVLDTQHRQDIGANVRDILRRDGRYRVDLVDGSDPHVKQVLGASPSLIIAVLPAPKERAERLLTKERLLDTDIPLLAVISSKDLNEMLDGVLVWMKDFLVAPICETELLARVKRLMPEQERKGQACDTFGLAQLIGQDPAFEAVKRQILLIAQSECTALILGETGTGKELCARAVHYLSRRADGPFLPVNCGAIPVELFERELFGHQKGAFTSAWVAQPGLIAEAEGGTLFLDEIETLSLGAQAKLLRFLQDQTYCILGSPKLRKANVRVIASTNVELSLKVQEGNFREDLLYRLVVLVIKLPPLREQPDDIPLLAAHFWKMYAENNSGLKKHLSPRAVQAFCRYSWPGNVRELESVIQRLLVLCETETIEPKDLPILPAPPSRESENASFKQAKAKVIEQFVRTYITRLLGRHQGNITHAAEEAKKDRRALGRLIKKYQIPTR